MALTKDDVLVLLLPDEADLNRAASRLGSEALPLLGEIVDGPDPMLASKAAYVAGMIPDPRSAQIVQRAATKKEKMVRVAAATVAERMPAKHASEVLITLLRDDDAETRRIAIEAVKPESGSAVFAALRHLVTADSHPYLRELAADALKKAKY